MAEQALHKAIVEEPEDDVVRLVYADWLDEDGRSERADLLRVQVELAKLPDGDERRDDLAERERELLEAHESEWLAPVKEAIDTWVFHRGMLGVATSVRQFLAHAESLTDNPLVCYIDIADHAVGRDGIAALARSPHLARVTYLDLAGWYCCDAEKDLVDDEQAELLASSPFVGGLEILNLRCNTVGNHGARAIAESSRLGRLRQLDLRANRLGDSGVSALASSRALLELASLDLSFNDARVTEAGWRSLASAAGLPKLSGLGCIGNRVSREVQDTLRGRFGTHVHFGN